MRRQSLLEWIKIKERTRAKVNYVFYKKSTALQRLRQVKNKKMEKDYGKVVKIKQEFLYRSHTKWTSGHGKALRISRVFVKG